MDFTSPMLTRRAFAGSAVLFGAALALAPSRAFAVSAAEKQAEADAVRAQLVSLQADLEQAEANYHRAIEERDAARAAMDEQQVLIDASTRRISDLQQRLGDRAVSMYRTGPTGFLDFMLGAKSFDVAPPLRLQQPPALAPAVRALLHPVCSAAPWPFPPVH